MCRCKCAWWMVLEWNAFVVCSIGFDLYSSQHQEGLACMYMRCQGQLCPFFFRAIRSSIVLHDIELRIITKDKDTYCSF